MAKKDRQTVGRNTVSGRALLDIIERVERIREEKKSLGEQESAVLAEAKAAGYDPKTIRNVIKRRSIDSAKYEEAQASFDVYMHAIGMSHETPLFRAVGLMSVDLTSREEVIEALKLLVPATGEIIVASPGGGRVRLWRDDEGAAQAEDYVEKPKPSPAQLKRSATVSRLHELPDVDDDGARELGVQAGKARAPITQNPFPRDDSRRDAFDRGWREANWGVGTRPEDDE